jgi:hypothetical protein
MKRFHAEGSIIALSLALSGCMSVATVTPEGERIVRSPDEFRDYVEQVFRYQNRVGDELIARYDLGEAGADAKTPQISAAEERMAQSCQNLNDVVSSHMAGSEPSLSLRMQLVQTVTGCDYAARALARLIGFRGTTKDFLSVAP